MRYFAIATTIVAFFLSTVTWANGDPPPEEETPQAAAIPEAPPGVPTPSGEGSHLPPLPARQGQPVVLMSSDMLLQQELARWDTTWRPGPFKAVVPGTHKYELYNLLETSLDAAGNIFGVFYGLPDYEENWSISTSGGHTSSSAGAGSDVFNDVTSKSFSEGGAGGNATSSSDSSSSSGALAGAGVNFNPEISIKNENDIDLEAPGQHGKCKGKSCGHGSKGHH